MKGVVAMPSIVGNIKIINVAASSNVQIGDVAVINLSSSNKIFSGADSFSIGDTFGTEITNNQGSINNSIDPDLIDMPKVV
jgi:spore germination protein PA